MQRTGLWWAYLLSLLLNLALLFLLFTSFKLSLFNLKREPERVRVRLAFYKRPLTNSQPSVKTKSHKKVVLQKRASQKKTFQKKIPQKKSIVKKKTISKKKTTFHKKSISRKSSSKQAPKPKLPVITSAEEKLISKRIEALEKEKKGKAKELEALRKEIISSYSAEEAEKEAKLKRLEEKYRESVISLIKKILQDNFVLPVYLRDKPQLFAIVSVDVDTGGNIVYHFLQRASDEGFNQAVEECLKISSPLPVEGPLHFVVKFKAAGLETLQKKNL